MATNGRPSWNVERPYGEKDVERLRGTVAVEHTLARRGSERLRELLSGDGYVRALGLLDVGAGPELPRAGHACLREPPGEGVRRRGPRLQRDQAPAQVGAGYFDEVAQTIAGGDGVETAAIEGSTEEQQF